MEFKAGTVTASAPSKLQQTVQTYSPDASTILEKLFITAKQDGATNPESEYVPLRKRSFPISFWNFMAEVGATGPTGLAHPPHAAYTVKKGKLFAEQAPAAAVAVAAAAAAAAASPTTSKKATVMEKATSTGAERIASISKPASLLERTPTRPEKPSRKSSVSGKFEKEKKRPRTPAKALADGGASKTDKRRKSAPSRQSKISQVGKRLLASTTSIKGDGDALRRSIGSLRPSRFIDIRSLSPTSSEDSRISSQTDCSLADCVSPFVTPTDAIQNQQRSLSCPPITGSYGMDTPMQMVELVDDFTLEQEFNVVQRGDGARSMFELGGQDAIHLLGHMDTSVDLFDDGPDSPGATPPGLLFSDHRKHDVLLAPEARPLGTFTTIKMEHIR